MEEEVIAGWSHGDGLHLHSYTSQIRKNYGRQISYLFIIACIRGEHFSLITDSIWVRFGLFGRKKS